MNKHDLYAHCQSLVQQKLDEAGKAMHAAQAAANEETKSSAGDKYETGRAMMHLEKEKLASQHAEALKLKKVIDQINPDRPTEKVELGSLVETSMGWFFVAIGLGQVKVEGQTYFLISPAAPIGRLLWGKSVDESFTFNGKEVVVKNIE